MSVTIQELANGITVNAQAVTRRLADPIRATEGLKARKPPAVEGLHSFTPEELLSLYVQTVAVNGDISGYQRDVDATHARKVAEALLRGKPMPVIHVALDGRGRMSIVDGQHRALGAVIARLPIEGVVRRMDKVSQAELFFGQRQAKTVDPNIIVLSGTDAYSRYVQEAITDPRHAWSGIVSASRSSKTRLGPYSAFQLLLRYVANTETGGAKMSTHNEALWDRGLADELAPLIACFGNKQTHPLAFRPYAVQAIGATAIHVFRRRDPHADDYERWQKHMPLFPFEEWLHVRTQRHMITHLIDHWNKRLQGARRVER